MNIDSNTTPNADRLSPLAIEVIDAYQHLKIGAAEASVPYFNNKTTRARMTFRVYIGKGSPQDVHEELQTVMIKHHIAKDAATSDMLKKMLVDENIGIDCSAYAYYILDAESRYRGLGHINRRLKFIRSNGPIGKMRAYLRPAENCDVRTLLNEMNSRPIALTDAKPGDFISMTDGPEGPERDHILVITSAQKTEADMMKIDYTHAVAYPEDGRFNTGIKFGAIEVASPDKPITEQAWTESGSAEKAATILARARRSKTDLRRLKWF
jgi:hypothetical protein